MHSSGRSKLDGQDDIAKVLAAAPIVAVVGEFVKLRPAGREYKALCPFHDDHNPSMAVVPHKGLFHCFVCGAGGDAISFIRKYLKLDFREALELLAERYGVTLTPWKPGRSGGPAPIPGQPSRRQQILSANSTAAGLYRSLLNHPEHGAASREAIAKRAISPEMVERFSLGASPAIQDGLYQYIRKQNLPEEPFFDAGLLKRFGAVTDNFRHRLIFPIQDAGGRVIAFGARRLDDTIEPKYLNSPESVVFSKKATLYGLNHALRPIQNTKTAILTEGYMDTIACHQAGVTNAVAALGTSLTREHATSLRRLCNTVVLLFDGDDAGQKAADRAVEVFFAEPLDVKIATLSSHTDAKDPDELLKREGGRQIFDRAIEQSEDLLTYRFRRLKATLAGAGIAQISQAVEAEIDRLLELGLREVEPVRKSLIVQKLSQVAGVPTQVIERAIPAGRAPRRAFPSDTPTTTDPTESDAVLPDPRQMSPSEHILGCLLCDGNLWASLRMDEQDAVAPTAYRLPLVQKLAQLVRDMIDNGEPVSVSAVLATTDDLDLQSAAVRLASHVDDVTGHGARLSDHFKGCVTTYRLDRERAAAGATGVDKVIELKRQQLSQSGFDRRVLPRPR